MKQSLRPLALAAVVLASPVSAQTLPLGGRALPPLPVGGLPPLPAGGLQPLAVGALSPLPVGGLLQTVPSAINGTTQDLGQTLNNALHTAAAIVHDAVGRPGGFRSALETVNGMQIVRGEVLAIAPAANDLATARAQGFTLLRQENFTTLGLAAAVLLAPDSMNTEAALAALRKADPAGHYDYNHIYEPSGDAATAPSSAPTASAPLHAGLDVTSVGMIDAGLDRDHPAFKQAHIEARCFAANKPGPPTAHGTAVASLLIGDDDSFHGFLKDATLYAADVYCGQPSGGSAEAIVRALAWLAQNRIAVANVSLSGPPNALLGAATAAFIRRGEVLVAAVGNGGPAAPQTYPAAYPGVVGVTSVDAENEIQLDANRGPDVAFAARGVDVRAATLHGSYTRVTGTSFAAPVVTALFARLVPAPDPTAITRAWLTLRHAAVDLGAPGRDPVFGYGYLGPPASAAEPARMSSGG